MISIITRRPSFRVWRLCLFVIGVSIFDWFGLHKISLALSLSSGFYCLLKCNYKVSIGVYDLCTFFLFFLFFVRTGIPLRHTASEMCVPYRWILPARAWCARLFSSASRTWAAALYIRGACVLAHNCSAFIHMFLAFRACMWLFVGIIGLDLIPFSAS